jgi:hypothetical protein
MLGLAPYISDLGCQFFPFDWQISCLEKGQWDAPSLHVQEASCTCSKVEVVGVVML